MINTGKKYTISCLIVSGIILIIFAILTFVFDPYFHFHKPYDWVSYELNDQRYQNDGIVRNFNYDAIITGSSMTDNFSTTEFNKLFNVNSIKIPFSGAKFKEINDILAKALEKNSDLKMVIRSLDLYYILRDKDEMGYSIDAYPTYLYDNNIFNDVKYLFNKTTFFDSTLTSITKTINKEESTTFDSYSIWYQRLRFGKDVVDKKYDRAEKSNKVEVLTEDEKIIIRDNLNQNIIELAEKYPNTDFYLFLPPYSIYWWDGQNQAGVLNKTLDTIEYALELLTKQSNIHICSLISDYGVITNLNNYRDITHYSEKINSRILKFIKREYNMVTADNYKEYMNGVRKYYTSFNYDKLFS